MDEVKDKIIVSLDGMSYEDATMFMAVHSKNIGTVKLGLELITGSSGEFIMDDAIEHGVKIFYDGKFDDIPNTTKQACYVLDNLFKPWMFNVHMSSGPESVKAAVEAKGDSLCAGVTVLTSITEEECELLFGNKPNIIVPQYYRMLLKLGADAVICSSKELLLLRDIDNANPKNKKLLKVVPGIRPSWSVANDQKRVMTPSEAIKAGADYLIIGRPITKPPKGISTEQAIKRIIEEITNIV